MAGGRPTKYKKEYCERIVEYMREGRTFDQFAAEIDVHIDSIHEWAKKHKEFSEAKKKAEKRSKAFWEDILHRVALGVPIKSGDKILRPDRTSLIFLMKCRFRDTYGDQLTLADGNLNFTDLPTLAAS